MSEDRILREKAFHDQRFGGADSDRQAARKYYSILAKAGEQYRSIVLAACPGAHLLEYGCASGRQSIHWLKAGARVTGIDISSEAIEKARENIKATPYADRAEYYEMNAEAMTFEDDTFDLIVGSGILHHLDLEACYSELSRVLKPGGLAIFKEPLGHNPLINLYRNLTPKMRTEDEHPLLSGDIKLAEKYFADVEATPYNMTTLLAVPFRKTSLFRPLFDSLHNLDKSLFNIPFMRNQAWTTVIQLRDPHKRDDG
jgi:SAM-dependent methyltransferase